MRLLLAGVCIAVFALAGLLTPTHRDMHGRAAPSLDALRSVLASTEAPAAGVAPLRVGRTGDPATKTVRRAVLGADRRMRPEAAALLAAVRGPDSARALKLIAAATTRLRRDLRDLRGQLSALHLRTAPSSKARELLRQSFREAETGLADVYAYAAHGSRRLLVRAPRQFSLAAAKAAAAGRLLGCSTSCGRLL